MTDLTTRLIEDIRFLYGEDKQAKETLRHTEVTLPNCWAELEALDSAAAEKLRHELESPPPEPEETEVAPAEDPPPESDGDEEPAAAPTEDQARPRGAAGHRECAAPP